MGALDNLLRCTVGGASFSLENYKVTQEPIVVAGVGRMGSSISVQGTGWIQEVDADAFGATVAAMATGFAVSGLAFSVYGLGGVLEYQLLPTQCVEGGPHLKLTIEEQSEALVKPISFEVSAKTYAQLSASLPFAYTETITTRPDGLRSIERDGQVSGSSVSVQAALGDFRAVYPSANWVIQTKSTSNSAGTSSTYTFTAVELRTPYIGSANQNAEIVDGDCQVRTDRDEQLRITTTYEYDILVVGDYTQIVDAIRSDAMAQEAANSGPNSDIEPGEESDATVMRETVSVSVFKEVRVRASFSFLRSGGGNSLLDWTQSLDVVEASDAFEMVQYNGADPVLVQQPAALNRVVQQGRATGLGSAPKPPDPIIDDAFLERPRVTISSENPLECETTWYYVMAGGDDFDIADYTDALTRPESPDFYGNA